MRAWGANTSLFTVSSGAYALSDTNSCAIATNNIITSGNYQFVAFYSTAQHLMISRRDLTTSGTPT